MGPWSLAGVNQVENRLLADLPQVESSDLTTVPLLLIDTAGCNLYEAEASDGDSRYNEVGYLLTPVVVSTVSQLMHADSVRFGGVVDRARPRLPPLM